MAGGVNPLQFSSDYLGYFNQKEVGEIAYSNFLTTENTE